MKGPNKKLGVINLNKLIMGLVYLTNTPFLGIDHLRFGLIGAPICLVVMVVVSLMTKEPSPATQKLVDDTRIPTGKAILGKQH